MTLACLARFLVDPPRPPSAPVAIRRGQALSREVFAGAVAALAGRLRATGRQRAVIVLDDSFDFAVALFAAFHAGMDVALPPNGKPETLAALRQPDDCLVDASWLPAASDPTGWRAAALDPLRLHVDFFTSGSTGTPKAARWTLAGLQAEIAGIDALWGDATGRGTIHAMVPHQHRYGFSFKILWGLASGRPFDADTDDLWESVLPKLGREAVLLASPAHLTRMGGLPPVPDERRPSRIFTAGAPFSHEAGQGVAGRFGAPPTEIFGSTEAGAFATRVQDDPQTFWAPLPGVAIRIDAEDRLCLAMPARLGEGWTVTADRVAIRDGRFQPLGRTDRVVKIEAKRVDLGGLEQLIEALDEVAEAAVTLLPGPPARLAAAIVPSPAGQLKLAEIGNFRFGRLLRRQLGATQDPAALPRSWRFVPALPGLPMGKRSEPEIRRLFGAPA